MSQLTDLIARVASITAWINGVGQNSKKNEELPKFSPIDRNALVRGSVSGISKTFTVQELADDIGGNNDIVTVFRFVSLDGIDTVGKPIIQWASEAINQAVGDFGNFTCGQGELMTFYFNFVQPPGISGTPPIVSRYYVRLCTGENVCSGISNAFLELMPDGIDKIEVTPSILIDLGDIGTDEVEDAFNNDVNQPFAMTDEKFVQATQNGELKLWQWRGGVGSFGNGATLAIADDFLDLTLQPVIPTGGVQSVTGDNGNVDLTDPENPIVKSKPLVTPDTGTEITLYPFGNFCNSASPNLEDTEFNFVLTNGSEPAGEMATVLIKTAIGATDFPEVAGALCVGKPTLIEDELYDLNLYHNGNEVCYYFVPHQDVLAPEYRNKQATKTGNYNLTPELNDHTIFMDGGIVTIDPNTQSYQKSYTTAIKNKAVTDGSIVCTASTDWTYKVNDAVAVASGTFDILAGATFTVIRELETKNIYIDGGVE